MEGAFIWIMSELECVLLQGSDGEMKGVDCENWSKESENCINVL